MRRIFLIIFSLFIIFPLYAENTCMTKEQARDAAVQAAISAYDTDTEKQKDILQECIGKIQHDTDIMNELHDYLTDLWGSIGECVSLKREKDIVNCIAEKFKNAVEIEDQEYYLRDFYFYDRARALRPNHYENPETFQSGLLKVLLTVRKHVLEKCSDLNKTTNIRDNTKIEKMIVYMIDNALNGKANPQQVIQIPFSYRHTDNCYYYKFVKMTEDPAIWFRPLLGYMVVPQKTATEKKFPILPPFVVTRDKLPSGDFTSGDCSDNFGFSDFFNGIDDDAAINAAGYEVFSEKKGDTDYFIAENEHTSAMNFFPGVIATDSSYLEVLAYDHIPTTVEKFKAFIEALKNKYTACKKDELLIYIVYFPQENMSNFGNLFDPENTGWDKDHKLKQITIVSPGFNLY